MGRSGAPYFDGLPDEVLAEILLRVPALSLQRHRGVCRRWRAIIEQKQFADAQFRHTLMRYPSLLLFLEPNTAVCVLPDSAAVTATAQPQSKGAVDGTELKFLHRTGGPSSANDEQVSWRIPLSIWRMTWYQWHLGLPEDDTHGGALMCYRSHHSLDRVVIVVGNPVTRKQMELPPCPPYICRRIRFWMGFDLVSGFYKVVLVRRRNVYMELPDLRNVYIEPLGIIHTIGKDRSWRLLDKAFHEPLEQLAGDCQDPTYYRGRLHWSTEGDMHVFDLATEKMQVLNTPEMDGDLLVLGKPTSRALAFIARVDGDSTHTMSYRTWVLDEVSEGEEPGWTLWDRGDINVPKNLNLKIDFLSSLSEDLLLVRCSRIGKMIPGKYNDPRAEDQEFQGLACYNIVDGTLSCLKDNLPPTLVANGRLHRYFLLHPSVALPENLVL